MKIVLWMKNKKWVLIFNIILGTTAKKITFADYESAKFVARPKLMTLIFTHYFGNQEVFFIKHL